MPLSWPIVVADDDALARELIISYLRKLQLRNPIVTAADGEEACAVLEGAAAPPALLLLDLEMPRRSGLDVLRWLRQNSGLDVPVVMLTGSAELGDVDEAFELGIASYLVKPVGFAALQDVLTQLRLSWALVPPTFQQGE